MKPDLTKKAVSIIILLNWLSSFFLTPVPVVRAHEAVGYYPVDSLPNPSGPALQTALLDPDFDGLTTAVEQAGWSNEAGGPYITDPNKPDTDGDGLTDGQEQLYNTNPTNDKIPGIYVEYRPEFQTKKFYSWRQFGNKFIVHGDISPSKERDVIIRRGTSFTVGGPQNATLDIIKSNGSLNNLKVIKNSCGAGWLIEVPANGTAGTYTLRLSEGGWSKQLTLHVIFELDQPGGGLTQEHVDVLAYNDDLANEKDLITIYWDTSYDYVNPEESGWTLTDHKVYGWAIGWETDYNKQYLFEDYVMPTIQGADDRVEVAERLRDFVANGAGMEFNPNSFPNKTKNALRNYNFDQDGDGLIDADCNGHAGVMTTFLNAVGLTSRPIAVDWKHKHYDTATEVWLDGQWLVSRSYSDAGDNFKTRQAWGDTKYKSSNDLILVVGPTWPWEEININYQGPELEDYSTARYESLNPPHYPFYPGNPSNVISEIRRWDWVETPVDDYWGKQPATVIGDCSNNACNEGGIGLPFFTTGGNGGLTQALVTHPEIAHFGKVLRDYGVDQDGDGRYDNLVVEVEVVVNQPGFYTLEALLNDTNPKTRFGTQVDAVDWIQEYIYLDAGSHVVPLTFSGLVINQRGADGPYVLEELLLTDLENPVPGEVDDDHRLDLQHPDYLLAGYSPDDFDGWGATLTRAYSHQTHDTNRDGFVDRLTVYTTLDMTDPGIYGVKAELVNSTGEVVATADWTGSDGKVALEFEATLASTAPYFLRNVELYRGDTLIDSDGDGTVSRALDQYAYTTGSLYNVGQGAQSNLGQGAQLSANFTVVGASPIDTDSDGDFDKLDFTVSAVIAAAGQYELQGWLESSTGALIAWRKANMSLNSGAQQLKLSFDGQSINAFRANGPYKLVALKLLSSAAVVEKLDVAFTTQAYSFSQFDSASVSSGIIMIDGVEGDPAANWNLASTDWSVTKEAFHTPLQSWTDSPGGNYKANATARLTSKSLALTPTGSALPAVSFQSCYAFGAGDNGKVQMRINGQGGWVDAGTFSGSTSGWQLERASTHLALGATSLEFRFQLTSDGSNNDNGWYVDDVVVTVNSDIDEDGIPNDVEGAASAVDTDGDGTPDYLDSDSDNDGIPDAVEGTKDSDGDGTPDYRDTDSDNDGIPDADEGTGDTDGDGKPDYLDTDADNDGLPDGVEGTADTDGDGKPDFKDTDSDNDGIPDGVEGTNDSDGDGKPDFKDTDSDNDTILDKDEWSSSGQKHTYCTNDGGLDTDKDGLANCKDNDVDGDGIPNYLDKDSDGDGINDFNEVGGNPTKPADSDGDGIPDYYDSENLAYNDGPVFQFHFLPLVRR